MLREIELFILKPNYFILYNSFFKIFVISFFIFFKNLMMKIKYFESVKEKFSSINLNKIKTITISTKKINNILIIETILLYNK